MLNKREEQGFISWLDTRDTEHDYLSVRAHHELYETNNLYEVMVKWFKAAYEAGLRQGERN